MLHSSCKQCRLERREADAAVSDATRGLVLAILWWLAMEILCLHLM